MNNIIESKNDLIGYHFKNPLFIHNFDLSPILSDDIELSQNTINRFIYEGKLSIFPKILIDINDSEKDIGTYKIMKEYVKNIYYDFMNFGIKNYILLNRIYRIKYEDRTFMIQILYKKITQSYTDRYYIFIFECFKTIDDYLEFTSNKNQPLDQNQLRLLSTLNQSEYYVFVAYRDINCQTIQYDAIFSNDSDTYMKVISYYGDYLMTSIPYTRNNILSILYVIYGIILDQLENIYEYNIQGEQYANFIILELYNATVFDHKDCPYCKLGFKLSVKGFDVNKHINQLKYFNEETKRKIITNKDIQRLSNKYYLKNLPRFDPSNPDYNLHSTGQHYFNPAHYKLDDYVYEKIIKTGPGKLGNDLVLKTNLVHIIRSDLERVNSKQLLISNYIDLLQNIATVNSIQNYYSNVL